MTIELKTGILDITVVAPDSYPDQTMGLAGVMNGNITDDFLMPNGTTLPITSSERTIYFEFGEKCKYNLLFLCDKLMCSSNIASRLNGEICARSGGETK